MTRPGEQVAIVNGGVSSANAMRQPTLETLGLGGVLDIFRRGALPERHRWSSVRPRVARVAS